MFPQMFSQLTANPWWMWVAGAAAVIYLIVRPRHILGVLIIGCVVWVSWFFDLPHLVGLP